MEDNKDHYYRSLRRAQASLDKDDRNLGDWVGFFLRSLVQQKDVLVRRIERERLVAPLPPLAEKLLLVAREQGRLTMGLAVRLTNANRNTVKARLRHLVADGHLVMHGRGKGAWYETK